MLLPKVPEEVDRVLLALPGHEEVNVTNDGEREAGGGQGEVAPHPGHMVADVHHHQHWDKLSIWVT